MLNILFITQELKKEVDSTSKFQSTPKSKGNIEDKATVPVPSLSPEIQVSIQLKLRLKVLTQEFIIRKSTFNFTVDLSYRYYQLIIRIHSFLHRKIRGINFESIELYSDTGYPLAVSPSKYLQRISEWNLEQNTMLYVYQKEISVKGISSKNRYKDNYSINIAIESTDIIVRVVLCHVKLFCCDIKTIISLQLHIPVEVIVLKLLYVDRQIKEIPNDLFEVEMKLLIKEKVLISIQIMDHWEDESYLGAFNANLYKSCVPHNNVTDWDCFNCILLYLAKEQLKENREDLFAKLGLLRRISCSPPLIYALYRLLTGCIIYLPHRVAINEGIMTTLSFLMPDRKPEIHNFSILWMYLEQNALQKHSITEVYETHYISKHTREKPRDSETMRLLQAFPPTEDTIITWSDCPSAHEPFSYRRLSETHFSQNQVNQRFPIKHPIELYKEYLTLGIDCGLLCPPTPGLSSYSVFLGPTKGRYGYFEFFDPHGGKSFSCNPHDIITSDPLQIEFPHTYPKLIIILDISGDMNLGCNEYAAGRASNEPNLLLTSLDMAFKIIELLIDNLIGIGSIYLLGIILISNDHHHHQKFTNGIYVLQPPTLEYVKTLKILREFVDKHPPLRGSFKRLPQGIIVNALFHLFDNFGSNTMGHKLQVYLLTNHMSDKKFYGSKINSVKQKFLHYRLILNTLILSESKSQTLSELNKSTKGQYIDQTCIARQGFNFSKERVPSHYLLEYFSLFEDNVDPLSLHGNFESYGRMTSKFIKLLTNSDSLIESVQRDRDSCVNLFTSKKIPNLIQIMRQISNYSKGPSPYCKIFSIKDNVQHWLCIIQGPDNTPYQNSVLLLEIRFGIYYPQKPPKFRFLSSYYHPNIRLTGEVCHPILFEDYHPDVSLRQMLDSIYEMICSPVSSHAVRYKVMEIFSFHKEMYRHLVESFLTLYEFKRSVSDCLHDLCVLNITKTMHPEPYLCPLTGELFDLPVMTPEGNTYERHAILQHLKHHKYDPFTKALLTEADLIRNNAVLSAVYKYRKKCCEKDYWWEQ